MSLGKVLLVSATGLALIVAQDSNTVAYPAGNGSSSAEAAGERKTGTAVAPEITRAPDSLAGPSTLSGSFFYPGVAPYRPVLSERAEPVPYFHEYPNFIGYPMAHSIEHSVGTSPKQLVVVSFIGLLLLFAIIQNTIAAVKRREASIDLLSNRRRRDLTSQAFDLATKEQEEILNDDARIRCIQRTVCQESGTLVRNFGLAGKILAKYLMRGVERSLKSSLGWDRLAHDASLAGIRGENCSVLYRDCSVPVSLKLGETAKRTVSFARN